MKGDFSRDSFDLRKNFSRVLMQQGRVQLDADFNEQSSILLHYLRTLASDLIGQHAGPPGSFVVDFSRDNNGVILLATDGKPKDLTISTGHYYVDGILCENAGRFNNKPVSYSNQPNYPMTAAKLPSFPYLIYLDVWERHITCFENESLCEVALGEIDTTTRAQIVWQVKLRGLTPDEVRKATDDCKLAPLPIKSNAELIARTQQAKPPEDPCNIEPDARYRGAENQLYRVEIHTGNVDESGKENSAAVETFKWSRENGSVVFAVMDLTAGEDATEVRLANLGRDDKFSLREGDWVELIDDAYTLNNRADNLMRIASIDRDEMSVSLMGSPKFPISENPQNHPLMRRWDQKAGVREEGGLTLRTEGFEPDNAAEIIEGEWLTLEDGIQIQFPKSMARKTIYRTGDYWLIPARTATGDVLWSKDDEGNPQPQPANGIKHHYAPLGIVTGDETLIPCRCTLNPIKDCGQTGERPEQNIRMEVVKTETAKSKGKKSPK